MSSIPDADFELDNGSWTTSALADIQSIVVYDGNNAMDMRATSDFDGSNFQFGITENILNATVGQLTSVTIWVNNFQAFKDDDGEIFFEFSADYRNNGSFPQVITIFKDDLPFGDWVKVTSLSFTPLIAVVPIRMQTVLTGFLTGGIDSSWYIDIVEEIPVAIKLSERAIDAMVVTMQANLATELTAIDTERGDGVTMLAPAADSTGYKKFPLAEFSGSRVQVEVFEDGGFDFINEHIDIANDDSAEYRVLLMVRLSWFNGDGDDVNTMYKRMRRYACGMFNVMAKNPTLGGSDDMIQAVVPLQFIPFHGLEGEDVVKAVSGSVAIPCEVWSKERQA